MWLNRALSLAIVGGFLGLARFLVDAREGAALWPYLTVLSLGYGHVVGAALGARSRPPPAAQPREARGLRAAFIGSSLLTLFVAYAWALGSPARQPFVLTPLLLIFAWHIVENDVELGRACCDGLRLGAVRRASCGYALALAVSAAGALVAFATPEGAVFAHAYFGRSLLPMQPWLTLDELIAAFVLYHTASWLLFLTARVRRLRPEAPAEAARLRRRLLAFHLAPLAVAAALQACLPAAAAWLAAPPIYLFWSALHTVHTAIVRGLEPRAARA